jgi:hypothetical protein
MGCSRRHPSVPDVEAFARDPVTLIGRRGDAADSAREFLEGNEVAVRWIDLDRDPLAAMLTPEELDTASLRLAVSADGRRPSRSTTGW